MSLVRLLDRKEMAVFIDPSAVAQISPSIVTGCSVVALRRAPEAALTVKGTPDEVHTALFKPRPSVVLPDADLIDALNPATYEAEWGTFTPEQTRAMQHALALVRARLGVG